MIYHSSQFRLIEILNRLKQREASWIHRYNATKQDESPTRCAVLGLSLSCDERPGRLAMYVSSEHHVTSCSGDLISGKHEQVVAKERPDIEKRKTQLLLRMAEDKKQLSDLEARILHLLSNSSGNILDDEVMYSSIVHGLRVVASSLFVSFSLQHTTEGTGAGGKL